VNTFKFTEINLGQSTRTVANLGIGLKQAYN